MQIELEKISIALSIVLQLYYLGVEKFRACSNNTGPVVCAPKKKIYSNNRVFPHCRSPSSSPDLARLFVSVFIVKQETALSRGQNVCQCGGNNNKHIVSESEKINRFVLLSGAGAQATTK